MASSTSEYRERVYRRYVSTRRGGAVPKAVEELRPRMAHLRKFVRLHFPPNRDAAIVDLGCGHGALIHYARELGYQHVTGIDRSAEQVAIARRLGIDGVREGDLMEALLAMPEASHDAVMTFDVIEHFHKAELIPFADQVIRVLRPGGIWIIHTVNGGSPFFGRVRYGDLTHETVFTEQSLRQLLVSSGFASVKCYEDVPVAHGVKSSLRWLLWEAIRIALRLWLAAETGDTGRDAIFTQNLIAVATRPGISAATNGAS
jgi:2-polyprenyl-3-methyl-5-hydroxy-6-metoxy-1,4-benzoquinol methylase